MGTKAALLSLLHITVFIFSSYIKVNQNQGRLDYYNDNPDRKRDASQRNVVNNSPKQEQGNKQSRGIA